MTERPASSADHSPSVGVMVTIESGMQGRRSLRLPGGVTAIGAGLENDIVLFDDDLAERHFELRVNDDGVSLRATGGPVTVIAGASVVLLEAGGEVRCRDGIRYQAGTSAFLVSGSPRPARARSRRILPRPTALTAFAAGIAVAITCLFAESLDAAVNEPRPSVPVPEAQASSVRPVSARMPSRVSVPVPATEIDHELAVSGLDNVVVSVGQDGALEADGTISPLQRNDWERIRRWFDARFGDHAILIDRVSVATPPRPIAIEAISAGEHPFVIDREGRKLLVGAQLGGGWTIAAIGRGCVIVRAGARTFAVRF